MLHGMFVIYLWMIRLIHHHFNWLEELIVDDIPIFERAFLNPCGVFVQNLFEGLFVFARKPFKSLQLFFPTEALDKYMYTYPLA